MLDLAATYAKRPGNSFPDVFGFGNKLILANTSPYECQAPLSSKKEQVLIKEIRPALTFRNFLSLSFPHAPCLNQSRDQKACR